MREHKASLSCIGLFMDRYLFARRCRRIKPAVPGSDSQLKRLKRDDLGATALEYALIMALVVVAVLAAFSVIGGHVRTIFSRTSQGFSQVGQDIDSEPQNPPPPYGG